MRVEISRETYENYRPVMFYLRMFGMFPVTVQRENSKLFLKYSLVYLIVWWIIGGYFILYDIWVSIADGNNKSESMMLEVDTDKLMLLTQAIEYVATFFVGAFINTCRFEKLFAYISCIMKVDLIMNTTYEKSEKYKLMLIPALIILFNVTYTSLYIDNCFDIFGAHLTTVEVIKKCYCQNVVSYFAWVSLYMNVVMLNSLDKRIQKLNELLEFEYDNLTRIHKKISPKVTLVQIHCAESSIVKLSNIHLQLMDAADILTDFLRISFLITTLAVFWALIYALYFLMLDINHGRGDEGRLYEIMLFGIQLCAQLTRAGLLINPAYGCLVRNEQTKSLVCKLSSCNVSLNYRKQVNYFTISLLLRELEFSACGFLVIDRFLMASLIDTITTILMVLQQYRNSLAMFEDN